MSTMLVAATGGHLAQLHQLRKFVIQDEEHFWVTFDTPQSRSLLRAEDVEYVPYVAPRDWVGVARNARLARQILQARDVHRVFSTGSGIALSFLPLARGMGAECTYIESAARSVGPSVTGRILSWTPGVKTFTQYDSWVNKRWPKSVSVFDDYELRTRVVRKAEIDSVVVTLGTIQGFGFRSLVERLLQILPPHVNVLWQVGDTDVSGLPIEARQAMPQAELAAAIAGADVVIAHAGIGSALSALQVGKAPVLVPRRASRNEHVDDHQVQIALELGGRGLAVHREVDDLHLGDLVQAASLLVGRPDELAVRAGQG